MGSGSADRFQTSVIIRLFGRPELRKTIVDHMASRYVQLRPYSDPLATKTPINPTTPVPQYDRVTGVEIAIGKDNLDAIYKQQEEMLEYGTAERAALRLVDGSDRSPIPLSFFRSIVPLDGPPGMLSKLLHYQRKGLGWLVAHEVKLMNGTSSGSPARACAPHADSFAFDARGVPPRRSNRRRKSPSRSIFGRSTRGRASTRTRSRIRPWRPCRRCRAAASSPVRSTWQARRASRQRARA